MHTCSRKQNPTTMISQAKIEDAAFDITDCLQAPVLTHDMMWASAIPERILKIIPQDRLITQLKGEEMASLSEALVFIQTRTLLAPMDGDWTDIFCWLGCKVVEQWFKEDRWEDMGQSKTLTRYQEDLLKKLRVFIYEKRRTILKQRIREQEKAEKVQGAKVVEMLPQPRLIAVQGTLF